MGTLTGNVEELGLCLYCCRTRWLAEVEQTEPYLAGKCRQCRREGVRLPVFGTKVANSGEMEGAGS
jgi:hypothetical protein